MEQMAFALFAPFVRSALSTFEIANLHEAEPKIIASTWYKSTRTPAIQRHCGSDQTSL
ncbi:MAG: hypothetical protein ABIL01_30555 [Pseudomonadota bacterium]